MNFATKQIDVKLDDIVNLEKFQLESLKETILNDFSKAFQRLI